MLYCARRIRGATLFGLLSCKPKRGRPRTGGSSPGDAQIPSRGEDWNGVKLWCTRISPRQLCHLDAPPFGPSFYLFNMSGQCPHAVFHAQPQLFVASQTKENTCKQHVACLLKSAAASFSFSSTREVFLNQVELHSWTNQGHFFLRLFAKMYTFEQKLYSCCRLNARHRSIQLLFLQESHVQFRPWHWRLSCSWAKKNHLKVCNSPRTKGAHFPKQVQVAEGALGPCPQSLRQSEVTSSLPSLTFTESQSQRK